MVDTKQDEPLDSTETQFVGWSDEHVRRWACHAANELRRLTAENWMLICYVSELGGKVNWGKVVRDIEDIGKPPTPRRRKRKGSKKRT